jgi:5'-3' exonuclease
MGIKSNFKNFLKENCSTDCFKERHLSHYAFEKVAVDTTLFLYKFKAIFASNWLAGFISLVAVFRKNQVHLLFVFDGPAPEEKREEQLRRRVERKKIEDRVNVMWKDYSSFIESGIFPENLKGIVDNDSPEEIKKFIEKKQKQIIDVSSTDFNLLKEMLTILQIPWVVSYTEAEKYASQLCIEGKVKAVLSDDTDVLAYCSPLALSDINIYTGFVLETSIEEIHKCLQMTSKTWLDFCILCGTDFNKNIENIGSNRAYKLIKEHSSIENINEKTDLDVLSLNHVRSREIFTSFEKSDLSIPYCGRARFNDLQKFIIDNNLHIDMSVAKFSCGTSIKMVFE